MEVVPFDFVDEFAKEDLPMEKIMGNAGKASWKRRRRKRKKAGSTPVGREGEASGAEAARGVSEQS